MQPSVLSVYHSIWKQSSTCSSGRACHPHAFCACSSPATVSAKRPLPRQACRRTPLLRVNRADDPAATRLLDCALRRRDAALLIQHNIQIDYSNAAFTSRMVLAGPRPAAESAHNKTLQLRY